jgi:predicted acylesterase/phospholipase RssA/CRP-like cAMP-binding protein
MTAISLLRNVPVLAGLSDELLHELLEQVSQRRVAAGAWILREGETADSLFIVVGGRVEVLDEGPPETLIRVLRRGDVLGELALLREGTRSVSARARRDVDLLELPRADFESLISRAPSFALGLTRAMGAQLAESRTPVAYAALPRTIAVVGLDARAPTAEISQELVAALGAHGTVAVLGGGGLEAIDQAERDVERVLLLATADPEDEWSRTCVLESDVVLAITSAVPEQSWLEHARILRGCELLFLSGRVSQGIVDQLQPREVQVINAQNRRPDVLQATARRLAGRSLGLVLSGGGARALAHLGALEELHDAGLRFDRVAGVSLGSLVAAGIAMGLTPSETYARFERAFNDSNPTRDITLPAYSLLRGTRVRRMLEAEFGERRIEELPLRFFCLSCDLVERESVIHRSGRLVDAVYASFAIPGIFPPVVREDGRLLVDGGVLDNLPVETMARTGEGPVIAVDVTGSFGRFQPGSRPSLARLSRPVRRLLTGSEEQMPGLGETIVRTLTVGSVDTVAAARLHAALVITPRVEGIGLMDWSAMPRARELGREAARQVLAAEPELPSSWRPEVLR